MGTRSLNVSLTAEMAEMIEAKVASGEYANESDVVRDGLETLKARDAVVDHWLRTDVANTYDAHMSDPSRAIPAETVIADLEERFALARKAAARGA